MYTTLIRSVLTNAKTHILLATKPCPSLAIPNPKTSLYFKAVHKENGGEKTKKKTPFFP